MTDAVPNRRKGNAHSSSKRLSSAEARQAV
jgi:hypothetical protein